MKVTRMGVLVLGVLFLVIFPLGSAFSAEKVISLRYANFFPPTHVHSKLPESWGKEIEKRTDGRVRVTQYPGGTLGKGGEIFDNVVRGIADIGQSVPGYTTGRFPVMAAHDHFFGFPSGMAATLMINDFYNKFKPKEFDDVKVLYWSAHGPGILHTKKPVHKLEDLQGMKIRCTGTNAAMVKALGAIPVGLSQGESYEALQKGVVEGTFVPFEAMKGFKQGEVVKYHTLCYDVAYSQELYVVMNLKKWNSLPKDIQKVFEDVSEEWITKTGQAWDQIDEAGLEFCLNLGDETIPLSKEESARWVKTIQPVIQAYIDDMESKGFPGGDYIAEYRSLLKKYGSK